MGVFFILELTAMITAKKVSKEYSAKIALDGVDLSIPKGSIYGLLGPNGAGKTSFIRIMNQITAPDKGEVYFGSELLQPRDIARIGYLPEERGLYKKMKVGEQALYLAQLKGMTYDEALSKLRYWFKRLILLNGGQKKLKNFLREWHKKFNSLSQSYMNLNYSYLMSHLVGSIL